MKTLTYSKLTRRFLSLAGLVVTGTVVGLPASAQVESPSMPMGAPSMTAPKDAPVTPGTPAAPTSGLPTVDDAIESTVNSVHEAVTPGSTETTEPEAAEATETTETEATKATEATKPESTEATETEATETTETTEPEASEATETTETPETVQSNVQSKPTTSEVAPTGEAAPTTAVPSTTVPTTTVPTTTAPGMTAPSSAAPSSAAPSSGAPTSQAPATETSPNLAAASGTIVDVASASNTFQTLVSALTEAQLAEVLQGEGPFTVFAPTDEAFAALPPGVLDELMKPENREILVKILKYHVVPGEVGSSDLTSGEVTTAEGSPINVAVDSTGGVTVNGANVVQADIPATNGVIHAIDRVIIPPDLK